MKLPATRSAILWMGALLAWASSTKRMIWERAVSLPTWVASKRSAPVRLTVPPITLEPTVFSTGKDSPVIMASSMAE